MLPLLFSTTNVFALLEAKLAVSDGAVLSIVLVVPVPPVVGAPITAPAAALMSPNTAPTPEPAVSESRVVDAPAGSTEDAGAAIWPCGRSYGCTGEQCYSC